MERTILIAPTCFPFNGVVSADEPSQAAYELAETRLLAEWVGLVDEQYNLGNRHAFFHPR